MCPEPASPPWEAGFSRFGARPLAQLQPLADALDRVRDELDAVIAELQLGTRSTAHFEDIEERVQAMAGAMVQAVRGSTARPQTVTVTPGRNGGFWIT